jgi:hypothetical protein
MTANPTTITRQLLMGSLLVIICEASVIAQTNPGVLNLAWQDNSTDESGFIIERGPNGIAFEAVETVGAGVTNYMDADLSDMTTYHYRLRAFRNGEYSIYANTTSGQTGDTRPPLVESILAAVFANYVVGAFSEPVEATTAGASSNEAITRALSDLSEED